MGEATIVDHLGAALSLFMVLALPPLIAALVVGLVIGVAQAATQIQDQTMPLMFKLFAVIGTLAVMLPILAAPLIAYAEQVFSEFAFFTR